MPSLKNKSTYYSSGRSNAVISMKIGRLFLLQPHNQNLIDFNAMSKYVWYIPKKENTIVQDEQRSCIS
jgi:hypothetical protein